MKFLNECKESSGVEMQNIVKIQSGQFGEDDGVKKFVGCLLRKTGVLDSDGQIVPKEIRAKLSMLPKEDVEKVVKNCAVKKGANIDETAFLVLKCSYETNPNFMKFAA